MASTPLSSISLTYFFYIFLLLLLYSFGSLQKSLLSHLHFEVSSLLASDACNRSFKAHKQGSSLEILHKHSPCIEGMNDEYKKENFASDQEKMILQDQNRVNSIHLRFIRNTFKELQTRVDVQSGVAIGTGNYFVTVALGTPRKDLLLIFDTGSAITWTQCEPCVISCYRQSQPKFDPRKSSSYNNVSCSSSSCNLITDSGSRKGCTSSTCVYRVDYGDGSYSVGFFASEKITIGSSDVLNNFLFGCGQGNIGTWGRAAGLLGLGRSTVALPLQTANKYKKLFSYCIPSSSSSTGYLNFGGNIGKKLKFTPLSPDFEDTPFYGLDIIGISVGGQKLDIDASVYSTAGTIIDSGTVITRLPPTVYSAMSSAFQELMKDYPMTDGVSIFDTCYDLSDYKIIKVPRISIFFKGGVEVEINVSGILVAMKSLESVCLAFAPNSDDSELAIFGNYQQKTYEVVHDLAKGRVGFAAGACN